MLFSLQINPATPHQPVLGNSVKEKTVFVVLGTSLPLDNGNGMKENAFSVSCKAEGLEQLRYSFDSDGLSNIKTQLNQKHILCFPSKDKALQTLLQSSTLFQTEPCSL